MKNTRCTSKWQQMASQPIIQCARREGHRDWHFNTREERQWQYGIEITQRYPQSDVHVLRPGSDMFHAMDCPGCMNTPFTLSPRSETYWSS